MTLYEELAWRGLIKDKTFENPDYLSEPKTFYLGVDVGSSDSLTIGNLAVFLMARRLLESGWKTILLVGGATSLIGDPGGKNEERPLVSREQVEHNKNMIAEQVKKLFNGKEFALVDNYDWFQDVGYLDFLREVGKHYSLTELIQRDFIAERIGEHGSGISYAEFSYSLIQGYDFWQLFKNHGAVLQIGGSDQWGNMLSGVPLIRKKENAEAHALSMPLVINKLTGKKFGKSEEGAIWLDPAKTSPTQFYQFWINVEDTNVSDYLKIYTFLGKEEIDEIMQRHNSQPEQRLAQSKLADETTRLVHGEWETQKAQAVTEVLTNSRTALEGVSDDVLENLRQEIKSAKVHAGSNLVDVLVESELAPSKSEARRLIEGKAVYINGMPAEGDLLHEDSFINGKAIIRRGKAFKDSALIELV
jgi:tyrosyl-tRNA synthetase